MLKKRIIPCLDIKDGRIVKGINFEGLMDAGNPIELAKLYSDQGADELVFLDITATIEHRKTMVNLVSEIAKSINIPFTVGGGISSLKDVQSIIKAGADKISINSSAIKNPNLITEIAKEFGSQCVVVAIDTKLAEDKWWVYSKGGREKTNLETNNWAKTAENLGAGEILLTSMNQDGTKKGFALELTEIIATELNIPVIGSGGAGKMRDFKELFTKTTATGALAASVFHYNEIEIPDLKNYLKSQKLPIR